MAASYQTGTATSPSNLLQTLETWLTGQGWTVDASATDGAFGGRRLHAHKSSRYVNFRSAHDEKIWAYIVSGTPNFWDWDAGYGIGFYMGTGYDSGKAWYDQPGGPDVADSSPTSGFTRVGVGMNLPSGSISAYHFFDDGADNVVVVVEKTPGLFVHFGWGPKLAGAGNPEDFWYFFGSSPSYMTTDNSGVPGPGLSATAHAPMSHSFIHSLWVDATAFWRVDSSTWTRRWISNSGATHYSTPPREYGWVGRDGRVAVNQSTESFNLQEDQYVAWRILKDRAYQTAYTGALLLPLHCHTFLDPAARWAHVGWPPSIWYSPAVGHGFTPTAVYPIGGVNYMVFPNFAVLKAA